MSSRRKQGRPQQRKILDSVEPENDLLVCGDCQTSFPLQDIVRFIRHKNLACTKDNSPASPHGKQHNHALHNDNEDDEDDDDDEEEDDNEEGPKDLSTTRKMEGVVVENGKYGGGRKEGGEKEGRTPLRPRQVVDAEANTTHTEPSKFVCEVCRLTVSSAWGLLQHAQKEHGMRIYNTGATPTFPSTPVPATYTSAPAAFHTTPPTTFPSTPQPAHTRPVPQGLPAHQRAPKATSKSPMQKAQQPAPPPPSTGGGPAAASFPGVLGPFFRLPNPFNRNAELHVPVEVLEQYRLRPQLLSGVAGVTLSPNLVGDASVAHAAFDRSRTLTTLDPQQTYSQRLKELANPTLSAALLSQPFTVPVLKPVQPNPPEVKISTSQAGVKRTGQKEAKAVVEVKKEKTVTAKERNHASPKPKVSSSSAVMSTTSTTSTTTPQPGKRKECDFCGKTFQFQSNLIVHRRCHTGERPFRCPLCPHACSQQSKLQRHMKTHAHSKRHASLTSTTTVSSDGSTLSTSSSPDSGHHKMDDTSEDDLDMEDDDDEEDMDDDFTDGDYDSDDGKGCDESFNPLTAQSDGRSDLRSNSQSDTADMEQAPTPTKPSSASLIREVMKNSGLNYIQPYNDAFKAALEENIGKDKAQDLTCKENGEPKHQAARKAQSGRNKSVKEEATETSGSGGVFSPTTFVQTLPADCTSSQLRAFFPGFPPAFSLQTTEDGREKNGSSTSSELLAATLAASITESALKVPAASSVGSSSLSKPVSGAALLAASSINNGGSPGSRKSSTRNDTCEYCGKVFKNCSNLTVHRRSHTGEKPYKCALCNYACAQSSKLTRHMKTHGRMGKDVFRCRFCAMPFSVPSTLEKHMRKCVEKRNAGLTSPEGKEEEEEEEAEGKLVVDQDSRSQSSPAPSMPTLSAQLQRKLSEGPVAQDRGVGDANTTALIVPTPSTEGPGPQDRGVGDASATALIVPTPSTEGPGPQDRGVGDASTTALIVPTPSTEGPGPQDRGVGDASAIALIVPTPATEGPGPQDRGVGDASTTALIVPTPAIANDSSVKDEVESTQLPRKVSEGSGAQDRCVGDATALIVPTPATAKDSSVKDEVEADPPQA